MQTGRASSGRKPLAQQNSPRSTATNIVRKSTTVNAAPSTVRHSVNSPRITSAHHQAGSVKDPVFLKDEGILRIYLRGRAINSYAPSSIQEFDLKAEGEPPQDRLRLEWVYGYRGRDCRNNIHSLPTGEYVYFIAAVVVLYNHEEQTQRLYLGHTDDVKCIAIHPNRITIATGQVAGRDRTHDKPHIRVWSSVNLNTLHVIGIGEFERAVSCIAFSKTDGGEHLCAIDEANEHIISVWEWEKNHKITETKSSTEPIVGVEYHPLEKNMIVTYGRNHLAFWTLEGVQLSRKMALFEKREKPKFILCVTFAENGDLVTGDSSGNIYVWRRGSIKISSAINGAHDGGIFSLCFTKAGELVSGGSKDRRIVMWDAALNPTGQEVLLDENFGSVRCFTQGNGGILLVGTTANFILQGSISLGFSTMVAGGHTDEVWALSCQHPPNGTLQFITGSYDKTLIFWDALTHQAVWSKEISDPPHSAAFYPSPFGNLVAIGTRTGRWFVLNVTDREIVAVHTDGNEQIECLQYSPQGTFLALGSRDNCIYVYSCFENGLKYSRVGKCCGHSSFITHLDWSVDEKVIRSTSGDYELLFWSSDTCRQQLNGSQFRDVQWASQNCVLGFEVAGIWPEGSDGTDINAVARNHKGCLLAAADDFGKVKLFRYPAWQPKSECHTYNGHSSHVTNVCFLADDSKLISCGGKDTSVMQWEVVSHA